MTVVKEIAEGKKEFLALLLLADEQESMIDRYLDRGRLFALYDPDLKTVAVVTDEGDGVCELKNLATWPEVQGQGYGRQMVEHLCNRYQQTHREMLVGTGDSPRTLPFYEKCGFTQCCRVKDFFLLHYDHPILEDGQQLKDMVYLKRGLHPRTAPPGMVDGG